MRTLLKILLCLLLDAWMLGIEPAAAQVTADTAEPGSLAVANDETPRSSRELTLLQLDSLNADAGIISRGGIAFLDYRAVFRIDSKIDDVRSEIRKRVKEFQLVDSNAAFLKADINIGLVEFAQPNALELPFVIYEGEVTVTLDGSSVPLRMGLLRTRLFLSLVDPISGVRSSPPTMITASGLTEQEDLLAIILLIAAAVALGLLWLRGMRARMTSESQRLRNYAEREERAQRLSQKVSDQDGRPLPDEPVPQLPDLLLDKLAAGQAVLAVGSIASEVAGQKSWKDIVIHLGDELSDSLPKPTLRLIADTVNSPDRNLEITDVSDVMDAMISAIGRERIIAALHRVLNAPEVDLSLYGRLSQVDWSGVLSFSLDGIGERMFSDEIASRTNLPINSLLMTPDQGEDLQRSIQRDHPFILKALGDLGDPDTVSLTLTELRRNLQLTPEYGRQLAHLLDTRCFLFVGVTPGGLKEYLQSFLPGQRYSGIRHFAIVPYDPGNDRFVDTLNRFGVQLLEYVDPLDPTEASSLVTFSHHLKEVYRERVGDTPKFKVNGDGLNPKLSAQRLKRLSLKNIGPFGELNINFVDDYDDEDETEKATPWTVLMGENGVGKTGVLRAISAALTASEDQTLNAAGSLLKEGTSHGSIEIEIGQQVQEVELVRDRTVRLDSRKISPLEAGQLLVLGFPALRGAPSRDPQGPRQQDRTPPQPADVLPLVVGDVDPRMADFKQWIVNVLSRSHLDESHASIRKLLDEIVFDLVPGDFRGFADLDERNTLRIISAKDGGTIPFSSVSQGMASVFNWIGLLTKRMYEVHAFDDRGKPHEKHAIVLIDEIDVHLHPDWQRRLVELSKKHFPNVQVIATTHSALIASSVHSSEVRIIERSPEDAALARRPSISTYGKSADYILQSDVMGLDNARPVRVEKMINEYVELYAVSKRDKVEDKKFADLEDQLGKIGWTPNLIDSGIKLADAKIDFNEMKKFYAAEAVEETDADD